jgi:hypothetical protein
MRFRDFHHSRTYAELIKRSKFVLCPRGFGVSSIRIFEAMWLGRVPVIISDCWQRPPGFAWEEFSVLVPEAAVGLIPSTLSQLESKASVMGQLAHRAFINKFAPQIFFDELLMMLMSMYSDCRFTTEASYRRAYNALGWREFRTLYHQARSLMFERVFAR